MKIIQAAALLLVGALGAILYVKVRGGSEQAALPAQVAVETPQAIEPVPGQPGVSVPVEPARPVAEPAPTREERRAQPRSSFRKLTPAREERKKPQAIAEVASQQTVTVTPPTSAPPVTPPPAEQSPRVVEPPAPTPPPPLQKVTLTAGMLLPVRLIETISSDRNKPGDTFTATLDAPLVVDGLVIAEKGARAEGRVVDATQAGRVKGLASIGLELTQIRTSDGQRVEIATDAFEKRGAESKGSDAAKIGGAAAIGAAIGAIAGGGKGAAIGAGVGGAAGTGGVLGTRGKAAVLPSETKISFRLQNSVTITERRR